MNAKNKHFIKGRLLGWRLANTKYNGLFRSFTKIFLEQHTQFIDFLMCVVYHYGSFKYK